MQSRHADLRGVFSNRMVDSSKASLNQLSDLVNENVSGPDGSVASRAKQTDVSSWRRLLQLNNRSIRRLYSESWKDRWRTATFCNGEQTRHRVELNGDTTRNTRLTKSGINHSASTVRAVKQGEWYIAEVRVRTRLRDDIE